ncbi:MAG: hypothetical protein JTT17_02095 [Candidatus Brockarchaeota archaeon]|nr:hypothetical protein [Candidatus Brockarchaeota archaeon]
MKLRSISSKSNQSIILLLVFSSFTIITIAGSYGGMNHNPDYSVIAGVWGYYQEDQNYFYQTVHMVYIYVPQGHVGAYVFKGYILGCPNAYYEKVYVSSTVSTSRLYYKKVNVAETKAGRDGWLDEVTYRIWRY